MRRSLGTKGRSDSEDGNLCRKQTGWGVFVGSIKQRRWNCLDQSRGERQPANHGPVKVHGGSVRCNLRMLIALHLGPATACLRHLSAIAMHGNAARTLRMVHRVTCHAGQDRRCSRQQKNQCDDACKAAHTLFSIDVTTVRSSVPRRDRHGKRTHSRK